MRVIATFARDYPWQSVTVLITLLLAGIIEGISLTALLPVLSASIQHAPGGAASPDLAMGHEGPGEMVLEGLRLLGITPSIGALLVVIVLGALLRSGLVLVARRHVGYTVAQVGTDLRIKLLNALLAARWEFYLRQPVGTLANAMAWETTRAAGAYLAAATGAVMLIQLVVYTWVAMLVSWKATLVYLAAGTVLFAVVRGLVRMARRAGKKQTKLMKSLIGQLVDTLQSVKPLKAMAREGLADVVLAAETQKFNRELRREVLSKEALKATQSSIMAVLMAAGVYVGIVHMGLPTATVLVLIILLLRVLANLGKAQKQYQELVVLESAYWSLLDTINTAQRQAERGRGGRQPVLQHGVTLEHIGFSYGDKEVLRDLSLSLPVGTLSALIGESGTGKTTIVDLLIGLLQPSSGRILIDDEPLLDCNLYSWRHMIGYVPQENLLLHDTVLHNVSLGDRELTEADGERALKAAGAWAFVSALSQGIHSVVGERGSTLSGGQRQRIMLARALAHRPKLLILDEATSALDPESEAAVCRTLRALRGELTILAVSHRPAIVEAADRVYRLGDGKAQAVDPPALGGRSRDEDAMGQIRNA
jgi:ATP-binding cassette subfamily C protein